MKKSLTIWSINRKMALGAAVLIVVILAVADYLSLHSSANDIASKNLKEESSLVSTLNFAENEGENTTIVNVSAQLINGEKLGKYKMSNTTLANVYLSRGVSLIDLKEYAPAIQDLQEAARLNKSVQVAALQGEVQAGYAEGQRVQLIPLLQQLEKLAENDANSLDVSSMQYKADIQDVENNQEPQF